jgi:uncharacterized membrane protein YdjX (TVP38/TMEM64 family)
MQKPVEAKAQQEKTSKLPLIISFSAIALLVAWYFIFPAFKSDVDEAFQVLTSGDQDRIRDWVSQFGIWGPIVIIVSLVMQMFMLIVPNILLIMISILSYGPVWGALLAWFGVFLASTVGYMIGNKLSPVVVHRLVSSKTQRKLKEFIRAYGMKAIIVLRLSTFSNDGLSFVAGLLNMKYRRFITATLIGITPIITVFAIFGKNGRIEKGILWVGVTLVVGLVIYIVIDSRRKKGVKK